jgi:hypothetical protein
MTTGRIKTKYACRAALFFLLLATKGIAFARAEGAPVQLPEVTFAPIEDLFYQDQYRALYEKTGLSLKSALRTVLGSALYSKSPGLHADYSFRYPIRVEIKMIPEPTLYHGLAGTAGWRQVNGQWVHVLTLNLGAYVQNPGEDVDKLLSHEMAHIVLADFLGVEGSGVVPMWLNEGLAQSVTDEGLTRVTDLARSLGWQPSMLIPCDLDASVDSFAHGEGNAQCYPEYYLATKRLEQIGGPSAVGIVIRSLRDGHKMADAYHSATGADYSLFQKDVETFMENVITDRKPNP